MQSYEDLIHGFAHILEQMLPSTLSQAQVTRDGKTIAVFEPYECCGPLGKIMILGSLADDHPSQIRSQGVMPFASRFGELYISGHATWDPQHWLELRMRAESRTESDRFYEFNLVRLEDFSYHPYAIRVSVPEDYQPAATLVTKRELVHV